MAEDWSHKEVEAVVTDYLDMLNKELRGEPFSKTDHNRRLQNLLQRRSKGSIEFKHQNISAVLHEVGYPCIEGYKRRSNYQELLRQVVIERLAGAVDVRQATEAAVNEPSETVPRIDDLLSIQVTPPIPESNPVKLYDRPRRLASTLGLNKNYLEIEARNRSLGRAGEELVVRFEHERLWRAGKRSLADRIEHLAATKGDHYGYDILSFEESGQERLIEVKTTRFGATTPFFASRNEVEVSEERADEYQLYRLFKFKEQPTLFVLNGSLRDTCQLDPVQFAGTPR